MSNISNPDRLSSASRNNESTEWDSLSGIEVTPISVPKDEISKIELSDDPMGEDRQDKRVDVTDASGMEKRTSNLMLGYNKKGVEIGKTYLSLEEFREKALESLEEDTEDEVVYFIRKDEGKRFAEPREVIDDMLAAIVGAGPEATFANDDRFPNQDARSVRFGGPNGEVQRGVLCLVMRVSRCQMEFMPKLELLIPQWKTMQKLQKRKSQYRRQVRQETTLNRQERYRCRRNKLLIRKKRKAPQKSPTPGYC